MSEDPRRRDAQQERSYSLVGADGRTSVTVDSWLASRLPVGIVRRMSSISRAGFVDMDAGDALAEGDGGLVDNLADVKLASPLDGLATGRRNRVYDLGGQYSVHRAAAGDGVLDRSTWTGCHSEPAALGYTKAVAAPALARLTGLPGAAPLAARIEWV